MHHPLVFVLAVAAVGGCLAGCDSTVAVTPVTPTPAALDAHCADGIGAPEVREVSAGVWVATGYDLANTILIETPQGQVVVDVGSEPVRAALTRDALRAVAPGRTRAVIYTHSHIDHVGGASAWAQEDTEIIATAAFTDHFFKQYGQYLKIETLRAGRQFGRHVSRADVACSALGSRLDMDAMRATGAIMPTRTFNGRLELDFGGRRIELVEAHGETHDQLFVWLPAQRTLLPGDNVYRAFPNLYTIRGTSPRPIDAWIASLDAMRRLAPVELVPSHTRPIIGRDAVDEALRNYRDGIQWVRDEVVRGANRGDDPNALAASIRLPTHLAADPHLAQLYGQVDWSVRAMYSNHLGWFGGDARDLYPMAPAERAQRRVSMMGGPQRVLEEARRSVAAGEPRWGLELLRDLEALPQPPDGLDQDVAGALEKLAAEIANSNGRAYLLESAWERRHEPEPLPPARPSPSLVEAIPMSLLMSQLAPRLRPAAASDVHESVRFEFGDINETWMVTVRRGVCEIVAGEPLPGTPAPFATVRTDAEVWRKLALKVMDPMDAIRSDRLTVVGSRVRLLNFLARFERGL